MNSGRVLVGRRKNSHGEGTWSFPGGHLEPQESFLQCAERELKEETGLSGLFMDAYPSAITNDVFIEEDKHYITLYLRMGYVSGEPKIMESDKCDGWRWVSWMAMDKLEGGLFLPVQNLLKQKYNPFRTC